MEEVSWAGPEAGNLELAEERYRQMLPKVQALSQAP